LEKKGKSKKGRKGKGIRTTERMTKRELVRNVSGSHIGRKEGELGLQKGSSKRESALWEKIRNVKR